MNWARAAIAGRGAHRCKRSLGRADRLGRHPRPARRSVHDLLADARERISPVSTRRRLRLRWRTGHSSSISARRTSGALSESCQDLCTFRARCWNGASIPTPVREPYISGLDRRLILFCAEGFSSSFAAASLRELGCLRATDMIGGFEAWKGAGLPVRLLVEEHDPGPDELPGMGAPEPVETRRRLGKSKSIRLAPRRVDGIGGAYGVGRSCKPRGFSRRSAGMRS